MSDSEEEEEETGLTPSDLKKLKALLKASSTAEAKTAAPKPAHASSAQADFPPHRDEEGTEGSEDYA